MTNVVRVNFRAEPSTFDDAWALVPQTMRRRSCKLATLRQLWDKHGAEFGQDKLLGALRAYVTDKDFDRHGGQGLHRWLKDGRYEHFVPAAPPPKVEQFPDTALREALRSIAGDDFVRVYLDPCQIDGAKILVRTEFAANKLRQYAPLFKSAGYISMKRVNSSTGKDVNTARTIR